MRHIPVLTVLELLTKLQQPSKIIALSHNKKEKKIPVHFFSLKVTFVHLFDAELKTIQKMLYCTS